jgi:hypothetical protein
MKVTPSSLRDDLYNLLDRVLEGGEPLWIERKGQLLKIVRADPPGKLDRLVAHECMAGDPEDLVHSDWSGEWSHDLP